jgi:two-component system sensor histidine kinase AlgZ
MMWPVAAHARPVEPVPWARRAASNAIALVLLACVLTAIQASMLGLRGGRVVLVAFGFNLFVSVMIGSGIDLGHRAATVVLGLEHRGTAVRLAAYVAVVVLAVVVGVESCIALVGLLSPRLAEVFPRAGVLWVAIPVTVVMVAIGRERERLQTRTALAERDAEVRTRQALRAELAALRSRTNPHFLFNALNTIAALIAEDPPVAERAVERLAALLRFALDTGRQDAVPLHAELAAVEGYLELERLRFGERMRTRIDVDPALREVPVPPMSLQPLVENAVLHAVAARCGPTQIELWARRDGHAIELGVRDDGPGGDTHHGTGTAQSDLRARLQLLHGADATLVAGPRSGGGYEVVLRLPEAAS